MYFKYIVIGNPKNRRIDIGLNLLKLEQLFFLYCETLTYFYPEFKIVEYSLNG